MIIKKRRINNLELYIPESLKGSSLITAVSTNGVSDMDLVNLGFKQLNLGETVLPKPKGPVSRFNANGRYIIHRDEPMETAYRQAEWSWKEWNGRNDYVERSRVVDIPYKRYPRTLILPPSVEISFACGANGAKIVCTNALTYNDDTHNDFKHRINLLLELFGECMIIDSSMNFISYPEIVRVNWTILPTGNRPWEAVMNDIEPIMRQLKPMKRKIAEGRLKAIEKFKPSFTAVGRGGFQGYLVFGFNSLNLFVLESVYMGNATYVFDRNWQSLSQLTKAEILSGNLQKARLIHREGWEAQISDLLK